MTPRPSHPSPPALLTSRPAPPPRVLRCADTADFLAALPWLTGFTAEDSLFLVFFSGSRGGDSVRVDLPEDETPASTGPVLDRLCALLGHAMAGSGAPAIAITTSQTFAACGGPPWRRFARRIERRLRRDGRSVRELACLAPDGWVSYLDPLAPRGGRPLRTIAASPVAREARALGTPPPPLDRLGEPPEADALRSELVLRALGPAAGARAGASAWPGSAADGPDRAPRGSDAAEVRQRVTAAGAACAANGEQPLDVETCAELVVAAEEPRDWLLLVLGVLLGAAGACRLAARIEGECPGGLPIDGPGWSIRSCLVALGRATPDPAALRRAAVRLADVIAHAPSSRRTGLAALAAWLWWLSGLHSVSERLLVRSIESDPEHALARMVRGLLAASPAWCLSARAA